jgi:tripartite-type tricarboxylate transporter receptor subunit TctC
MSRPPISASLPDRATSGCIALPRRALLAALAGFVAAASFSVATPALAQAWPNRPVKVIIPFPPGGTLDTVGRQLAQKLSDQTALVAMA